MAEVDARLLEGACVVTGAGSGLGRALAQKLASKGAKVAALGLGNAALDETAKGHSGITPYPCDLRDPEALHATFEQLRKDIGPVRVLVNNAAVYPRRDIFDETQASFMDTVATNLGGTFGATRLALTDMSETGFGRVLNVSSFADLSPMPASAAYAVSKGAQRILTRALIADLADRFPDIVISDWLPGVLNTQMGEPGGLDPEVSAEWGAALALWHRRDLCGTVFERNQEALPPVSLRAKLKYTLLLRRPRGPRQL